MSPNLRSALGLVKASEELAMTAGGGGTGGNDWRPPSFAGLTNSKPLTTLMPLVVGHNNKGLQVEYKKGISADDGQGGDDGDEWSEEEGWDYEGMLDGTTTNYDVMLYDIGVVFSVLRHRPSLGPSPTVGQTQYLVFTRTCHLLPIEVATELQGGVAEKLF